MVRSGQSFKFLIGDTLLAALSECGRYPYPLPIKEALDRQSLSQIYSAPDLVKLLHRILENAVSPSDLLRFTDLLVEGPSSIHPMAAFGAEATALEFAEREFFFLWGLSISAGFVADDAINCLTVLPSSPVSVSGVVLAVEPEHIFNIAPAGYALKRDLHVVPLGSSFADQLDPHKLWQQADCEADLFLALTIRAYQLAKEAGEDVVWSEFSRTKVGECFFKSLKLNAASGGGSHSASTFETCSRLLARLPKNEVKRFVVNDRGDGARAFRTHIGGSHEALRLMIWRLPGDEVEFANVGPKMEELIEYGTPHRAYSTIVLRR